jgi:hypothetical protein
VGCLKHYNGFGWPFYAMKYKSLVIEKTSHLKTKAPVLNIIIKKTGKKP